MWEIPLSSCNPVSRDPEREGKQDVKPRIQKSVKSLPCLLEPLALQRLQLGGKGDSRVITWQTILLSLFGVLVEKTCITDAALDRWHIRRVNVFLCQPLPCDFGEPWVLHHVAAAAVQVTKTLGQVVRDELRKQILGVWVDIWRVLHAALENILVNLEW